MLKWKLRRVARASGLWVRVCALLGLCGCTDDATTATQVVVVVYSNLTVGETLQRVDISVQTEDGSRTVGAPFPFELINPAEGPGQDELGKFTLPLSFGVVRPEDGDDRFRVVVTGYGTDEAGRIDPIIETQALASFQTGRTLQLNAFLRGVCVGRSCERESEIEGEPWVCYPWPEQGIAAGDCGPVRAAELPAITPGDVEVDAWFDPPGDGRNGWPSGDGYAPAGSNRDDVMDAGLLAGPAVGTRLSRSDGSGGDDDRDGGGNGLGPVTVKGTNMVEVQPSGLGEEDLQGPGSQTPEPGVPAPAPSGSDAGDPMAGGGYSGADAGPAGELDGGMAVGHGNNSGGDCGDGVCGDYESAATCCRDCGCAGDKLCEDNVCTSVCQATPFRFELSPEFDVELRDSLLCGGLRPAYPRALFVDDPDGTTLTPGYAAWAELPHGQTVTLEFECCYLDASEDGCLELEGTCFADDYPVSCECHQDLVTLQADSCDEQVVSLCGAYHAGP